MKKNLPYLVFFAFLFIGCSNNDDEVNQDSIALVLQEKYEVATFNVLNVNASTTAEKPVYEWVLTKNPVNQTVDSIVGNTKDFRFIAVNSGAYELTLNVIDGDKKASKKTVINVSNETTNYNPFVTAIYNFNPAPGMFANDFYTEGSSKEDVMQIALGRISETSVGYPIDLGGFGGSIVVGFDHTVVNIAGKKDFRVYGGKMPNGLIPTGNPPAPGLIYVAYDKNKNGKPDEDEWYEIIGSQHTKENTIKDFKITYAKPAATKPLVSPSRLWIDVEHVFCENNQKETYYLAKPAGTEKDFYPSWIAQNTMTFEGMKLNVDFETARAGQTTLWNFTPPEWGYVNAVNPDIDIDWAVDKSGNKANLPGVDFIKIVNCVSEPMGLCMQQSSMATQFSGAADLHILKKYNLKKASSKK